MVDTAAHPRSCGQLFLIFCKISLFTVGGGLAMLPFVEREVVKRRNWVSEDEFLDIFGISQSMPGVMIVNVATTVGFKVAGKRGACSAFLGTVIPPFVSILIVAHYFLLIKDTVWIARALNGIRPAVIALVVMPILSLSRAALSDKKSLLVPVAVAGLILLGAPPVYVLLGGIAIILAVVLRKGRG
jgi:chromate transporter